MAKAFASVFMIHFYFYYYYFLHFLSFLQMWRRKSLVRLLMEKDASDRTLISASEQRCQWYAVAKELLDPELHERFMPLQLDQETKDFLDNSLIVSNSVCLQVYYSLFISLLSFFLTKTSINGLLGRGSMFIFSHAHLKALLALPDDWSPIGRRLLDIGAGDGAVTHILGQFFNDVFVAEASKIMEWRLSRRGFTVISPDKWQQSGPYELISALNLLDRHHHLHELAVEHNCPVLLSVVLPIQQYVEFNDIAGAGNYPGSLISTNGSTFEAQANTMIQNVLKPAGFEVIRWTKLPYLCEGDLARAFYELDDAVFLLRAELINHTIRYCNQADTI